MINLQVEEGSLWVNCAGRGKSVEGSPEVDGLRGQQPVDFSCVRQWEQVEGALVLVISEILLVNFGVDFHIRERSRQDEVVYRERILRLGLQRHLKAEEQTWKFAMDRRRSFRRNNLVSDLTVGRLVNVALRVVDDGFDDPLVIECWKSRGFIEKLMDILVCPIRFHLKICHGKRLFQKLSQKFSQIVDMWFEFFSRWNGCWWSGSSCCGMDGSRQKSLSALFLLLYRVFYGFNYILTSRNWIFILKSIITWCKNQSNQIGIQKSYCDSPLWWPSGTRMRTPMVAIKVESGLN